MRNICPGVMVLARRKSVEQLDIVAEIRRRLPNYKAEYLFWKYAPCCLSYDPEKGNFEELKEKVQGFPDVSERVAGQWLLDDTVQAAVKILLERKNVQQLHELHEQYFGMARSDPQSLRALLELNKVLFKSDEDALMKLLKTIPDDLGGDSDE